MRKIDLNFLMKNLSAVFCIIFYIALLLPFAKVGLGASEAHILVNDYSTTFKGIQLLTDGSIFGIILIILPLIILLATYLPQLEQYKKIVCLISSIATVLLVITCSFNLDTAEMNLGDGYSIETHRKIGFWIMLVCGLVLTAISVIPFIKGETTNQTETIDDEKVLEQTAIEEKTLPQINFDQDKITGFAKNMANTIGEQGRNIANKTTEQVKNVADNIQTNHTINAKVRNEKPEEIMEQLRKLNELKETGILTEEEFTTKKQEMLERI